MKTDPEKLLKKRPQLIQTDMLKVTSHVQRSEGERTVNTLMIDGCTAPFRFVRKQPCASIRGQRVNLTYYPSTEIVGGLEFEVMKVVRIRLS